MKTFEKKPKMTTPPVRRGCTPVLPSFNPAAQIQRAQIRQVLRSPQVQAKLTIGAPNDKYEQEADRVADEVMRMPEPGVQRQIEPEEEETLQPKPLVSQITPLVQVQRQEEPEEEEEETLQAKPLIEEITPLVQRQVEPEEEEEEDPIQTKLLSAESSTLQRQKNEEDEYIQPKAENSHSQEITPNFESRIQSLKRGGQPLPESVRNFFEPRFGYGFSQVRVHTNSNAVQINRELNAQAFTHRTDIYFGTGRYNTGTSSGKRLLAHELTHVVQQQPSTTKNMGNVSKQVSQKVSSQTIQRYNKDVHYDHTKSIANRIFKPGYISEAIASEDQKVDSGWTHPTPTSIYPFVAPYLNKILKYTKVLSTLFFGFTGYIASKYIASKVKAYMKEIKEAIKEMSPRINSNDEVLHFPKHSKAVSLIKSAIAGAKSLSGSFKHHAQNFGKLLHLYQDSFSHSFPMKAGSGYNLDSKARHNNKKEKILAFSLRKFNAQSKFTNTSFGKGAVIRHVILGHYPDDFLENSEQRERDLSMTTGTKDLIKQLFQVMVNNVTILRKSFQMIFDSAVTHNNILYSITMYQMKSNSPVSLKTLVKRLNEAEGYIGAKKKYYILTPYEASRLVPKYTQKNGFYVCEIAGRGRYVRISSI